MPTETGFPRRGEKVWDQNRFLLKEKKSPHGIVTDWYHDDDETMIVVRFPEDDDYQNYRLSELQGEWTDKLGGIYLLYERKRYAQTAR